MKVGPNDSSGINLLETIALYAAMLSSHGQSEADDFLNNEAPAELRSAIRRCVNLNGVVVYSRATELFFEHYHAVPRLASSKKNSEPLEFTTTPLRFTHFLIAERNS